MRTVKLDETEDTTDETEEQEKPKRRARGTGTPRAKKLNTDDMAKEIANNTYQQLANGIRLFTAWTSKRINIMEEQPAQAIAYGSMNFGMRKILPRILPEKATRADKQDVQDITMILVGVFTYSSAVLAQTIENVTSGVPRPKQKRTVKEEPPPVQEPYMPDDFYEEEYTAPPQPVNHAKNDGIPDGWEDAYETPAR